MAKQQGFKVKSVFPALTSLNFAREGMMARVGVRKIKTIIKETQARPRKMEVALHLRGYDGHPIGFSVLLCLTFAVSAREV